MKKGVFYLSDSMCSEDRKKVIREIRHMLDRKQNCILIGTSLIEAGVDFDLPEVYRELAGLDSIIQAAGRANRANREGWRDIGMIHAFTLGDTCKGK